MLIVTRDRERLFQVRSLGGIPIWFVQILFIRNEFSGIFVPSSFELNRGKKRLIKAPAISTTPSIMLDRHECSPHEALEVNELKNQHSTDEQEVKPECWDA